jgi:hypothetical protein
MPDADAAIGSKDEGIDPRDKEGEGSVYAGTGSSGDEDGDGEEVLW